MLLEPSMILRDMQIPLCSNDEQWCAVDGIVVGPKWFAKVQLNTWQLMKDLSRLLPSDLIGASSELHNTDL